MTASATTTRRRRRAPKAGWKRRALGRGLVGLGAVLTVMWLISGWFDLYHVWNERTVTGGQRLAGIRFGGLDVNRYAGRGLQTGWVAQRRENSFRNGWFRYATFKAFDGSIERWISAPLWPLAAGSLAGGVGLVRWGAFAHARRRGRCAYCGYDLKGIAADAPCPECGERVEVAQP